MLGGVLQLASKVRQSYGRFLIHTRPDRRYFALDLLTICIAVITNTAMIWLMGQPLSLIQQGDYDALTTVLMVFAAVVMVNQAAQWGGGWLTQWLSLRFVARARNAAFSRLLFLSFPGAGRFPRGDLLARLGNDIDRVTFALVEARLMLFSHVLTATFYIFMLFWIDTRLALLALAMTPVFVAHQRYFSARRRKATEQYLHRNGELLATEEQALGHLRGISSNVAEARVSERHREMFERVRQWLMRERGLGVGFVVTFSLLIYFIGLAIVLISAQDIRAGHYPVGHLVSFLLYMGYLTVPVRGFADVLFQSVGNLPAADRVAALFDAAPLVVEHPQAKVLQVSQGRVEFRDVSFGYRAEQPLVQHLNLDIRAGETVAIVGPSGSGKSTLAALLMRFYDPQQGSILVDGVDISEVTTDSLRHHIAVVWQDPFYVNDTVRANLALVKPDASNHDIINACRDAQAWGFIEQLPQGLETVIGAGGVELSGGQRQRLAIAQALLRDAPILILDEASSALDSQSEQALVQCMERLRQGRTTIIIAHRYATIRGADRVIYLNGDGSVFVGSHEELLKNHAGYSEAASWQTRAPGEASS